MVEWHCRLLCVCVSPVAVCVCAWHARGKAMCWVDATVAQTDVGGHRHTPCE